MSDALLTAIANILQPWPVLLMFLGIIGSSIFAALPGVGVLLLITIVLPFSLTLDPYPCIALLLGIGAVSNTANTFPSVLIAVPGTAGSQATIVDGYPMAQRGEASRAFGAAFTASPIGGIIGAIVLFISLPILKPIVLSFGSPEFLMLVVWGLSAVGVLSGKAPLKGILAALLGVLVSSIGMDDKTGIERFSFDGDYLVGGVNIVLVGLGLFAVPEMIALSVRRTSIAQTETLGQGLWQGVRDTLENWWLVLRCAVIGVWVGVLPGLGSSVADWFAYAHTVQSEKNKENFGKGDVRGVIGPESSNNAKEGGALIPTIAFGIPGSTSLAVMLVAFISVGITPGSGMLTDQLPYTMAMVVVLVVANIIAAVMAIAAAPQFAKLSLMPFYYIVPVTLILCIASSFAAHFVLWDVVTFLVFSVLGYFMKLFDWPRPPFLVAVVLGGQLERYLWLSNARYGWAWLLEPGVMAIIGLIFVTLVAPMILDRFNRSKRTNADEGIPERSRLLQIGDSIMLALVMGLLLYAVSIASEWILRAALVVYCIAGVGFVVALGQIYLNLSAIRSSGEAGALSSDNEIIVGLIRTLEAFIWLFGLALGVWLVGFHLAVAVYGIAFVLRFGGSLLGALLVAILGVAFVWIVFDQLLSVFWPTPILFGLLGFDSVWESMVR